MTQDPNMLALADRFNKWVGQYATKVCPEGCLPTPGQEREISLFAEIMIALRTASERPAAGEKPTCVRCGAQVYDPCETDAQEDRCELPPATPTAPAGDGIREALEAAKAAMLRTRTASIAGCEEGYGKPEKWGEELFSSHGDLTKAIKLCDAALADLPQETKP